LPSTKPPGDVVIGGNVVAAPGRLLINRIGTGTYLDVPVFHHRELTERCVCCDPVTVGAKLSGNCTEVRKDGRIAVIPKKYRDSD